MILNLVKRRVKVSGPVFPSGLDESAASIIHEALASASCQSFFFLPLVGRRSPRSCWESVLDPRGRKAGKQAESRKRGAAVAPGWDRRASVTGRAGTTGEGGRRTLSSGEKGNLKKNSHPKECDGQWGFFLFSHVKVAN